MGRDCDMKTLTNEQLVNQLDPMEFSRCHFDMLTMAMALAKLPYENPYDIIEPIVEKARADFPNQLHKQCAIVHSTVCTRITKMLSDAFKE